MEQTPQETMEKILRSLNQAETLVHDALAQFERFPKKSKYGAKRMDRLIEALDILKVSQFDLPADWKESQWWKAEYVGFLESLVAELEEREKRL